MLANDPKSLTSTRTHPEASARERSENVRCGCVKGESYTEYLRAEGINTQYSVNATTNPTNHE